VGTYKEKEDRGDSSSGTRRFTGDKGNRELRTWDSTLVSG